MTILEKTRWIPISRELPTEKNNYLVTVDICDKDSGEHVATYTAIDHYNGNGEWTDNNKKTRRVIAWMPLEEPYKEESEDKE